LKVKQETGIERGRMGRERGYKEREREKEGEFAMTFDPYP
jgi:hypothetical protein